MIRILPGKDESVIVQGITGRQASFWTGKMVEAGTAVVAGVSPGRGGNEVGSIPVYGHVKEALENHQVGTSVLFTPPLATHDAAIEALDSGVRRLVILAEHIPRHDTLRILDAAHEVGARVIGPNTAGLVVPGECSLGIMPGFSTSIFKPGSVGIVSRSGSLGCLVCLELSRVGIGQSAFIGVGGDPVVGTTTREAIEELATHRQTVAVVIVGEVGGVMEEDAAEVAGKLGLPVVAFVAGRSAPPGRRMGHAGAIVTGGRGAADSKTKALQAAGVEVVDTPSAIPGAVSRLVGRG